MDFEYVFCLFKRNKQPKTSTYQSLLWHRITKAVAADDYETTYVLCIRFVIVKWFVNSFFTRKMFNIMIVWSRRAGRLTYVLLRNKPKFKWKIISFSIINYCNIHGTLLIHSISNIDARIFVHVMHEFSICLHQQADGRYRQDENLKVREIKEKKNGGNKILKLD